MTPGQAGVTTTEVLLAGWAIWILAWLWFERLAPILLTRWREFRADRRVTLYLKRKIPPR